MRVQVEHLSNSKVEESFSDYFSVIESDLFHKFSRILKNDNILHVESGGKLDGKEIRYKLSGIVLSEERFHALLDLCRDSGVPYNDLYKILNFND